MAVGNPYQIEWWWKWGRPAELWLSHRDLTARFVEKEGLRALPVEHLGLTAPAAMAKAVGGGGQEALAGRSLWPYPFPGGLRIPHLHLDAEIYPLDREQWRAYSRQVIDSFQKQLDQAGSVSFDQLLEVSNALGGVV